VTLRPGPPATPPDAEENAELRRRLSQELPAVRTAATQWRAGLLAILAATLGVGAFKGRETVNALSTGYGVTFGVLMGLCGLLAAGGVLACSYAAYGLPIWRARRSGLTVLDADEAHRASRFLNTGIVTALLATGLLAAAIGVSWFGPAAPKGGDVAVTRSSGVRECGELKSVDGSGVHVLVDGSEVVVPLGELRSVAPLHTCPAPSS
jgi:hypothetical protein